MQNEESWQAEAVYFFTLWQKPSPDDGTRVKVPDSICEKYFSGMNIVQMAEVVAQALEAWFSRKEAAYVQQ